MERQRLKALLGIAMIAVGLFQPGLFARQDEWMATGLGILYPVIGIAYLWADGSTGRLYQSAQ